MQNSTFDGIYIRDTLNDTGTIPSIDVAPTFSPDIICYEQDTLNYLDAKKTYNENICKPFVQDYPNNIYVRAKNLSQNIKSAKVRAYYASLNVLYTPNQWKPMQTISSNSGTEPDLVYKDGGTSIPAGEIAICRDAFYLTALENPLQHHCLLSMCSTYDEISKTHNWPNPPDKFASNEALWRFLRNEPRMAYNNLVIVQPTRQTVSRSVYYANDDSRERKYNVVVSVTDGLDSLAGSKLLIQSTNVVNPFSLECEIKANQINYPHEISLPPKFEGNFNFTCILDRSKSVNATLAVQNLLLNDGNDDIQPSIELHHCASEYSEHAEKMGDFMMIISTQAKTLTYPPRPVQSDIPNERGLLSIEKLIMELND